MDFVSVIVGVILVAHREEIFNYIKEWFIENMVKPLGQWFIQKLVQPVGRWLIEKLVQPVGQWLIEKLVKPVGQWLCYLFHYRSNIENMKEQVKKLRDVRERVLLRHSVDAATRNTEAIETDLNTFLINVHLIMEKARKVEDEKSKMRCSYVICLNLKQRYQLSKKAKDMVQDINEIMKNCESDKVFSSDYLNFGSRMSTVKGLMGALKDENINMIGLWGMPGVGKTTLVEEVAKQVKEEKLFDVVAIASVTHSPILINIQGEIADKLDLKLDKGTLRVRADLLRERLTKGNNKKILIILDNVWEDLDLNKIGISLEGSKVVVTSRYRDLLSDKMGIKNCFGLGPLLKEEAWCLFENLLGDSLIDLNLRSKAIEVCAACAGLPLALVTVAKTLRNKRLLEWEDAFKKLQRPAARNQKRLLEVIDSSIKLSYEQLKDPELESFFLFCAQNQVGSCVVYLDLLKKCFGLRFFFGISTLEDAREKLYICVRILKDSGLLLNAPHFSQYIYMHDLAREAALLIAYETQNVLMMRDEDPVEWPDKDDLKMCTSIFVINIDIHKLPDKLECPELRCLHVYAKDRDRSFEISDTFFKEMGKLNVLDLTYVQLSSLPSSLDLLTNLKTLCLDQCMLGDLDMAVIGKLKNLEILSLLWSEFKQLPTAIGLLTHLRMLDLSNCTKLEVIPPNILSCLTQLEELYVGNSFTQWEVEGPNNERASLAELKHLSKLTTLEVHVLDANVLPKDMLFEKLKRYKIFVGNVWDWSGIYENSRALKLKLNTSFQLESGIKTLLNGIEDLCIDELKGVMSIISELDTNAFQQLKNLHVQNNAEIKYIINSSGWVITDVVFPALEIFSLKNMINLEEIYHGQQPLKSFSNLRIVRVEHCEKLKFVFSSSIAKGLSQLQELEIRECSIMRAVVLMEEGELEDGDVKLFPQLRHLELQCLPKLLSFLSTQNSIITDVGEITTEGELDFHMPILHEQVVFPNLETLELSLMEHRARSSCKLTNMQATSRFQNLSFLKVKGSSLKYLLPSSAVRFMVQLKYLWIEECKLIEEIILTEELEKEEELISSVLFPRLEQLELKDLPILKRFCMGTNIQFPSLKHLCIHNCLQLKTFIARNSQEIPHTEMQPLFNEEVAFPNLVSMIISHMSNLEIIWHEKFTSGSFTKLQFMTVQLCESLMNIFQVNTLSRFQSLESLAVNDCRSVQEIFELSGQEVTETREVRVTQLKKLFMRRLPNLKHVWDKDPQETFSFQNLQELHVAECECLKSLFPISVARYLKQMEVLRISECGVEEIIEQEEGAEEAARFVFPKLAILVLRKLPKLKWFYRRVHTSEFPLLKTLEVSGSDKIQIFASKILSFQEPDEQSQLEPSIQKPLFLVEEVAFPNLVSLTVSHMSNLKIIWHDKFAPGSFTKLQSLTVQFCESLTSIFQVNMLSRFQSLESLLVDDCGSVQEIFELQALEVMETRALIITQLKKLFIHGLRNLKRVWNKDPQGTFSFQNLQEIEVVGCESLKSLFPTSVARCLQQLDDLRICKCGIEEIIEQEEGEKKDARFVFPKLTLLIFRMLPKLKWFFRGVHISEWPLLKTLEVSGSNQIQIFASKNFSFREPDEQSQLDTSIQQPLFLVEKVAFPNLESLIISHMHDLKIIWQDDFVPDSFTKLQKMTVEFCGSLKNIFQFNMLSRFHSLESLAVAECGIEEIVAWEDGAEQEARFVFPRLTLLMLRKLPKLKWFYRGLHTSKWPLLKTLEVSGSNEIQIFASKEFRIQELDEQSQLETSIQQPLFLVEEVAFPNLESLTISHMHDLKIIWQDDFVPDSFTKLQKMTVEFCGSLKNIFQFNMLSRFHSLESLAVAECGIEEIVAWEDGAEQEARFVFPKLTLLMLRKLPKLKWFYQGLHTSKWPLLKTLEVSGSNEIQIFASKEFRIQEPDEQSQLETSIQQPLFLVEEVAFPSLESLIISHMHVLKIIWQDDFVSGSFTKLQKMTVEFCGSLMNIFQFNILSRFHCLEYLAVAECGIEEIVAWEDGAKETARFVFPKLAMLVLRKLPKLKWFYQGLHTSEWPLLKTLEVSGSNEIQIFASKEFRIQEPYEQSQLETSIQQPLFLVEEVAFPSLESLIISHMHDLKIIWQDFVPDSFTKLLNMTVECCGSLMNIFQFNMLSRFHSLEYLAVAECGIEEIVAWEDGAEETARFVFPKLAMLVLRKLPKLKWFYRGLYTLEWPLLKTLEVSGSNEIQIFASKEFRIQEPDEQSQLETSIQQPLFLVEEVAFPSLETLTIMHMENLKIIWHDQLAEDSFFKLQSLFVEYCENLVNIFESNMLTRFQSLERLEVSYCGSLQEVFELQRHDVRESHAVTVIPLKILILYHLPKMKQVWNKDPQGIFSFQNLQEISVWDCESLKSLFPASVARCLMHLEDLRIEDCGVEEIVSREEIVEAAARFVFPKVTLLVLGELPKLKWFCRGVHTSEWPLLKELEVFGCDQIEIFASKILNFQETVEQSQLETSIQQPLFLVEEGTLFPNLEVLTLGGNFKMKEIQCDKLLEECFYKLKDLSIVGYLAISDWINFLKRLHSLEKLCVELTSWEEIFSYEELFDQENNATILAQLRELELYKLPTLTHLWKEDTQPSPILYNLENLIVSFCDKLKILVPSSVSFQNLTNLEILKCHGLINLVTSSTAKSLVQLKKMSVSECERITEVVVGEGGETSEVITFTQMIYLKLDSLPNLASFCSESYSFNFPSLEEVIVRQCPEMKTFSYGALGTPKLKKVQATQEDEWHWKVDLNTTIHCLTQ